jgi:hypothetical protein
VTNDLSDDLYSTRDAGIGIGYPSCCREIALRVKKRNYNDPNGYYSFFNLDPWSTPDEIRRVYRQYIRVYHPDGEEPNDLLFHRTIWIGDTLLDPVRKENYDNTPEGSVFMDPEIMMQLKEVMSPEELKEVLEPVAHPPVAEDYIPIWDYFVIGKEKEGDQEFSQSWYKVLHEIAPQFKYSKTLRIVISERGKPSWIGPLGIVRIPRWFNHSFSNGVVLFQKLQGTETSE